MFLLLHRNLTTTIRRRRTAWKWPVVRLLLSGLDDVRVRPLGSLYAIACIVFWTTVSLAAINWLIIGIARIISSWGRELSRSGSGMWRQFESIGFILASVTSSDAPCVDEIFTYCPSGSRYHPSHAVACSHRSPTFANRLGVDDLQYHVGRGLAHWSPQNVLPYNPPSDLADQSGDLSSVIYISP
ncbi:uncharacterized protein EDB91DRAFT_1172912, partial [Suillus paluster]|uniref:uncharacterized protein n=1 Tax=Suillus paluster TaxID=48578 RepID=UPI001B8612A0